MNLIFDKSCISINEKTCDLEKFEEKSFFAVLELIIENKENIKVDKHDNITPIGERFYEILNSELSELSSDLD